jgi:hypothetical protein
MPEDWAQATAKKVESRITEEADRAATQRKRFEDGIQRFRKLVLDLVAAVNTHIAADAHRIHTIVLDNGLILSAAYKRVVTVEEPGAFPDERVPACVGRILIERENRKALAGVEPEKLFVTAAGTQTAFYRRVGSAQEIKPVADADFKLIVEYFAS